MPRKIKSFNYNDTFPRRFRELLDSREDITQEAIAELVGVTRQTVGNWYSGKSAPDAVSLAKIADEFNVSIDWLLRENAPKKMDAELSSVCEYTGLSESAVQTLAWLNRNTESKKEDSLWIVLEMIINSAADEDMLSWLSEYRDALIVYKFLEEKKYDDEKLFDMINDKSVPYGVRVQARYFIAILEAQAEGLANYVQKNGGKYSDLSITTDEFRVSLAEIYEVRAQHKFNDLLEKIKVSVFGDPLVRITREFAGRFHEVTQRDKTVGAPNGEHPETNE